MLAKKTADDFFFKIDYNVNVLYTSSSIYQCVSSDFDVFHVCARRQNNVSFNFSERNTFNENFKD